ncbi:hypothetical protein EON68_03210 [archaeon]|nr:MAG: hypothetical protein EON68_03210 [archaeon]
MRRIRAAARRRDTWQNARRGYDACWSRMDITTDRRMSCLQGEARRVSHKRVAGGKKQTE